MNKIIPIWIFYISLILYLILLYFSELYEDNIGIISGTATALAYFGLSLVFMTFFALYLGEWKKLNQSTTLLLFVEKITAPYIIFFWPIKYRTRFLFDEGILLVLILIMLSIWLKYSSDILNGLSSKYPITDRDKKVLFLNYPPKTRSDMILIDLLCIFFCSMPLIFL